MDLLIRKAGKISATAVVAQRNARTLALLEMERVEASLCSLGLPSPSKDHVLANHMALRMIIQRRGGMATETPGHTRRRVAIEVTRTVILRNTTGVQSPSQKKPPQTPSCLRTN